MNYQSRIGILDSGVGGLSVYLPLRAALGNVDMVYVADTAFAPYGTKSQSDLVDRLVTLGEWFVDQGVALLVVACNTATVNGIDELRAALPTLTIVGMEPAVKPAVAEYDRVIVLGTNSTVTNPRYHDLVRRSLNPGVILSARSASADQGVEESGLADGAFVHEHLDGPIDVTRFGSKMIWHVGANELVAQVESGRLTDPTILEQKLQVSVRDPQALVIGCSHFSFLKSTIEKRWPQLEIFDGADGVVAQARKIALDQSLDRGSGRTDFVSTGPERDVRFIAPPIHFRHVEI